MKPTRASDVITEACQYLAEELDCIVDRLLRDDPILHLEQESEKWWIVVNTRNTEVMMRAEYPTCIRFAYAFKQKHPEARLDDSFAATRADALMLAALKDSGGLSGRTGGSPEQFTPEQAHALAVNRLCELLADPHSRRVPDNVIPLPVRTA